MKKIWKNLIILPLFIITALCFVACGEERMISIELSFDSDAIEYQGTKGYILPYSDNPYDITVKITPSSFPSDVLSWSSDATDVVVVNSGRVSTIGKGTARITAKYKNAEGETISDSIKVTVTKEDLPDFPYVGKQEIIYTGEDLKNNFKVTKEDETLYKYNYYYLNNGAKLVDKIKDAGEYRITYVHKDTGEKIAEMGLKVKPYTISIKAMGGSSVYGDELQKGFLIDKNPTDEQFEAGQDILDGIGEDKGKSIGKYVLVTDAKRSSNAGQYYVNIKSKLSAEHSGNYKIESIPAFYTITEKHVVLAVENQLDLKYGEIPKPNMFKLYDYKQFSENGSSIDGIGALSNNVVDYISNVADLEYVYLQGEVPARQNKWNLYDVGEYNITYKTVSSSKNIYIELVIAGKLKIQKKQVEIIPGKNSKIYGSPDDYSKLKYSNDGGIKDPLEIEPFLSIDYKSVVGDIDLGGETNYKAPVGDKYGYTIDNTKNANYFFVLANIDDLASFVVKPCQVSIQFADKEEMYQNPKNRTHLIGYYKNEDFDYVLQIQSMKINGVEQVVDGNITCTDEDFLNTGIFLMPTGETLLLGLKGEISVAKTSGLHFATYVISLNTYEISVGEGNFIVEVSQSLLHLNKTLVKVFPKVNLTDIYHKTYDADPETYFTMADFFISCDFSIDIKNINDIFVDGTKILSLRNPQGHFVILNEGGGYRLVDKFSDVGRYKIFLDNNLANNFKNGMEYYNFVLDDSQDYVYTIDKCNIEIIPDMGKFKIYGSQDPEITFTISDATPRPAKESDKAFTGKLLRRKGENKGLYEIIDSTLSLGDNYNVRLAEGEYLFEIRPRKITIEPVSYDVQYGESNIRLVEFHEINYGEEVPFDDSILKRPPIFEGEFGLATQNGEPAVKVNGQYLANADGEFYKIVQGTFVCKDLNYQIAIAETSTFTVRKRSVILNMKWENKLKSDIIELDIPNLDKSLYSVSNLLENAQCKVSKVTLSQNLPENPDYYYIDGLKNLTIQIKEGVPTSPDTEEGLIDTTCCYDIKMGQNILYYVERQVLNFSIKYLEDGQEPTSVRDVEFRGEEENVFKLVCDTPNYELDIAASTYQILYIGANNEVMTPYNVGSYSVTLGLDAPNSKLVVKSILNPQEKIEITKLDELQSGYIANLTQTGLLNIRKTNIRIQEGIELAFNLKDGALPYGSFLKDLPDLKTFIDKKEVFLDVKNKPINLKRFENQEKSGVYVNYKYKSSVQDINLLNASNIPYMINIMIQAGSGTDNIDPNYNALNLSVPLMITQRIVNITGDATITLNTDEKGKIIYSGVSKYCTANLPMDMENIDYSVIYQYSRINTKYNNSPIGKISLYEDSFDGIYEDISIEDLRAKTFDSVTRDIPSGAIIAQSGGKNYYMEYSNENIPRNAGFYACVIRFAAPANDNYAFKANEESEPVSNLYYYCFFEIEKSTEIQILDNSWKNQFYYGTVFNVVDKTPNNPLPFEFELNIADYKNKVEYLVEDIDSWKACQYILPIVECGYNINLFIDDKNYHFSEPVSFEIVSCNAKIELPANRRFTYIGVDEPITSFLKDIKVIKQDKDGNDIEKINYNSLDPNFTLTYYLLSNLEQPLLAAPYEVGQYVLSIEYGTKKSTHHGIADFTYTIAKRNYDGEIYAQNKTIEYNPTFNAHDLYLKIREMVYVDTDAYSLKIIFTYNDVDIEVREDNGEEWLKYLNTFNTSRLLKFDVDFYADEIANTQLSANLVISKMDISTMFTYAHDIDTFDYLGRPYYNELKFREKVVLDPGIVGEKEITLSNGFKYFITAENKIVTVRDNVGGLVFRLQYKYTLDGVDREPIAPNLGKGLANDGIPYKVEYILSEIGQNYLFSNPISNRYIMQSKEFFIKKLLVLNIKFDSLITRDYTGEEFNLHDFLFVSNYSGIEDNMNKSIAINPMTVSYSDANGVKFIAKVTKNDRPINKIIDAGSYKIVVSLLNSKKEYVLSNYFESLVFNGNPKAYLASDFKNPREPIEEAGNRFMFDISWECEFVVNPKKAEITDINKLVEYMNIKGKKEVKVENGKSILYIDANSTFELPANTEYEITFFKSDGFTTTEVGHTFEDLPPQYMPAGSEYDGYIEYIMQLHHKSGNYSDVNFIIRKYKPKEVTPPTPPPAPVE